MSSPVIFSADRDGVLILAIHADGTVVTRYRRSDGVLHCHVRHHLVFSQILAEPKSDEDWRAELLNLASAGISGHEPGELILLRRHPACAHVDFAIPLAPITPAQLAELLLKLPWVLLVAHDDGLSCSADRYAAYIERGDDR